MDMVKNEWKKLFKNKILLLSFVVILFIPLLYASFFLKSVWDPYGKAGDLPVAVVNNDVAVDYNGQTMDVGDQLVTKLKSNDELDWNFLSSEEAEKGLKDGKYYMIVTIPKDFSKNAATVLDKNPKKMELSYKTNGSLNYLGQVVSEQGAKQLKSEVSAEVTKSYAEAIFDKIKETGNGFAQAADGSGKLKDGLEKSQEGNKTISTNLKTLADSSLTFKDGANTLEVGLKTYTDGVNTASAGGDKLNAGVSTLAAGVGPLKDGVQALDNGATKLSDGVFTYTTGVDTLAGGINQAYSGSSALKNGLNKMSGSVPALADGVTQLNNGQESLADGLDTLVAGSNKLTAGLNQLDNNLTDKQGKITQLKQGMNDLQQGIDQLNKSVNGEDAAFAKQLAALQKSLTDLQSGLTFIKSNANFDADAIKAKINATDGVSAADKQKIIDSIQADLDKESQKSATQVATVDKLQSGLSGLDLAAIQTQVSELQTGVAKISAGYSTVHQGTTDAFNGIHQALNGSGNQTLIGGANQLTAGLKSAQSGNAKLVAGTNALNNQIPTLTSGVNQLASGSSDMENGLSKLNDGGNKLAANSDTLQSGATQLEAGTNQLAAKVPTLANGVNQLQAGSGALASGLNQLATNSPKLLSGTSQLADGSSKIADGSSKLANGSFQLGDGLTKLTDGSTELTTKLSDGAAQIKDTNGTDKTFNMIASPTKLAHEEYTHVSNYGHALAPYVLSLALYVGALVFNFIMPIRRVSMEGQPAYKWWLSKLSLGFVAAVAMALLEGGIMIALGLRPDNMVEFFGTAIITALAYMFLIMLLAMTFDNPGRFIAMVLLIVQLAGSGGTFPMPLTGWFFNLIHPFLPMTYSIYAFRESLAAGMGPNVYSMSMLVLSLILIACVGLLYLSMSHLKKRHDAHESALDDNQKLMALEN
ncbi:YhgE/Pip family protein [Listeria ivanovii]|uniref:Putative Transmembrane protein n=1 Tax=Listeria ivanovii (strain ATCC BAA-678 / PAM 55) TaxID=881621 RepID=G2ZEY4_LISIP|nr:YhgE/Pip domain-containing protein [Listeria ivanovii]AHI56796.1 membrane protein [Listeria ivanovii WSLC3009]AIS66213.1 membrane protein [Listeria ivanovii subsp. ivanovii]MBK3913767.1 YhgE/Pip domain-containing protein [Listeria ivanovii subsp. ivanovii]MBK3921395.1 YhgE/Pip domain-containing protein [Listeria ivanovii subsp. ivanovii]MBK3926559.1 YhgE/Pip domain-containing protein [Listeria ivanovii subsp. ivanovii]